MSFGKKPPPRYATTPAAAEPEQDPLLVRLVLAFQSIPKWGRQLAAFGCAVFMLGSLGIALQTAKQPYVDRAFNAPTEGLDLDTYMSLRNGTGITIELPVDGVSPRLAEHNQALRRACAGKLPTSLAREMSRNAGKIHMDARNPGFLACLMTKQTQRFCTASERKRLAGYLSQYVVAHKRSAANVAAALATPMGQSFATIDALAKDRKGSGISQNHYTGEDIHAAIAQAIQALSHNGYLSAKDFGRAPPPDIAGYLDKAEMEPCTP
jgi:hypothetical protein